MLKHIFIAASMAAALLVAASTARADHDVTVLLKSGERVTGQLASYDVSTIDIRDTSGARRSVPFADVVVLDFVSGARSLPAQEIDAQSQHHLLVLHGGEIQHGRVVDFVREGGEDAAVIFETSGHGRQQIQLDRVERIYVGPVSADTRSALVAGSQPAQSDAFVRGDSGTANWRSLTIPASTRWVDTGLIVRRGERITIQANGTVYLSLDSQDQASPAGSVSQRRAPNAPLSGTIAGALIGKVGEGQPFGIGDQRSVTMPEAGALYLGINDDELADNRGEFRVDLTRAEPLRSRRR